MAKKSKAKHKQGAALRVDSAPPPEGSTSAAAASAATEEKPGAATLVTLGTRKGLRARPEKQTPKELSALAKKAARARWSERMDAEGR